MSEPELPLAVQQVSHKLIEAGRTAILVGPGLRDLLTDMRPSRIDLSTDALYSEILEFFPDAVLVDKRRETVMIPGQAACVDVTPLRAGRRIESDLAQRDFSINAIAYDIAEHKWLDPYDGRADLEKGVLRAVRCARDRFDEDPIRALRGIRLAATRGWELDAATESALAGSAAALSKTPCEPLRRELASILLSAGVARALEQLDRSGIASTLAPGTSARSAALVERLPRDLALRLAGWLRGARARAALQRLRFSRDTVERVDLLLRNHHADDQINALGPSAAARFTRRLGVQNLAALIALRGAEIQLAGAATPAAQNALQKLEAWLDELRDSERTAIGRSRLAISGAEVMACLDCKPGPHVGRAIDYLAESIRRDPALNAPESLRALLSGWTDRAD